MADLWKRASKAALPVMLALGMAVLTLVGLGLLRPVTAEAAGALTVEIVAGYNLVVDSNAGSPSTYAPSAATVMGRFCNTSLTQTLTGVQGYIGDWRGSLSASTPGVYPARDSLTFGASHPLYNTGVYSFAHIGGRAGTADATRFVGTLAPGECRVQYWHIWYPQCSEADRTPPCSGVPVWGDSVKPEDDLWLELDMWATSAEGQTGSATWRMTMRNEISAMANKIEPEGNPGGRWFNTDSDVIRPGQTITSNGVHYELGNVRQGFDNNGDFIPDYNAWLQPIGDASYDPSCFRLIHTHGYLTITRSGGNPDVVFYFDDRQAPHPVYGGPLYFTNLPADNTGVTGNVYYTFLALDGPCATTLSPYQEVASGYDNEKFNGDYGIPIPPVGSLEPEVTIDKSGTVSVVSGGRITYTITLSNASGDPAGMPLVSMPLVSIDSIPASTTLVSSNASVSVVPRYSLDDGATYTTTPPALSGVTDVQWWLGDALPGHSQAVITMVVQVDPSFPPAGRAPFITNCASGTFGAGSAFDEDCTTTLVEGTYTIGNRVWRDVDSDAIQDTGELSITNVALSLYWDKNGDGALDSGDVLIKTTTTNANGGYLFDKLPAARYLVQVDGSVPQALYGYGNTTPLVYATTLSPTRTSDMNADFGFGPVLRVDKQVTSGSATVYETGRVTYTINLINTRPGNGTGQPSACQYLVWATIAHPDASQTPPGGNAANARWQNPTRALNAPDELYATTAMNDNTDLLGLSGFNIGQRQGERITAVWFVLYTQEVANFKSTDNFYVRVYYNDSVLGSAYTYNGGTYFTGPAGTRYVISQDITGLRSWTWSDFANNMTEMQVEGNKGGGGGVSGDIGLDAAAYILTTDRMTCGGLEDTIATLPLTDTFDASKLRFLYADPPQTGLRYTTSPYANTGVINWADLGPLYAGQTRAVRVIFEGLEPAGASTTLTNTAVVTHATFASGREVHRASDSVTSTLYATYALTGVVWSDVDADGWINPNGYEATDGRVPGAKVTLQACVDSVTGALIFPGDTGKRCNQQTNGVWQDMSYQYTDSLGRYVFTGLSNGYYRTIIDRANTIPGSSQTGDPNVKTGTCGGSCDNQSNADTDILSAILGTINNANATNINFGYSNVVAAYGKVWHDANGDGDWDAGEDPLGGGITVRRYDSTCTTLQASTTTNADGRYYFGGLTAGTTYCIRVLTTTLPGGAAIWIQTAETDGTVNNAITFQAAAGVVSGSHDFGFRYNGAYRVGDTVYADWNGDGDQDAGEEGLSGVTVYLYEDANGDGAIDTTTDALISTTLTDASGVYTFTKLVTGTYTVVVNTGGLPAWDSYRQTQDPDEDPGLCTVCNSRGAAAVSRTLQSDLTLDFGYRPLGFGSIGDLVWKDTNRNGFWDVGETGIPSITVRLYEDGNGNGVYDAGVDALVMTDTTDASGLYLFEYLPAGNYLVDVDTSDPDLPADAFGNLYQLSTNNDPQPVALASGQDYTDADFGFSAGGRIGDRVWADYDGDGVQDEGEPGIPGVTVRLYNDVNKNGMYDAGTDALAASRTTNASGVYTFTGVMSGSYVVKVDTSTLPSGYAQTGDPDKKVVCSGAECDSESGVYLPIGQVDMSRDFGYQPLRSIGDYVWLDLDGDGVQDAGEPGLGGVVVELTKPGGGGVVTTTTDSDGYYRFGGGDLSANGAYTVRVLTSTLPSTQMAQTYDLDMVLDNRASVTFVDSNDNRHVTDVDFGYRYAGDYSISGTVFYDEGGNGGLYGASGDLVYSNITLYLWDADHRLIGITSTTASTGAYNYRFSGLPGSMTYTVSVDVASPKLQNTTLTATPSGKNYVTVYLTSDVTDQDFGFFSSIDYGDLPDQGTSFRTMLYEEGARHTIGSLYLGSSVDADGDGQPASEAGRLSGGDDHDGNNDDDGVLVNTAYHWTPGATVWLTVTVTGGNGYLVGWFDWNNDLDFGDANEQVVFGNLAAGVHGVSLVVPASYATGTDFYARFRLYDGAPAVAASSDLATNGEVEDYYWVFGPTSVTLTGFRAAPAAGWAALLAALVLVGLVVGFGLYIRRRSWIGG